MSEYSVFSQFYDLLTENVDYEVMARQINEYVEDYRPHSALLVDLACGTGSLSVELAKRGFDVIGTDASCEMLSEAMAKNADLEKPILFLNQSLADLDLYGTVGVAVCTLDSINHITNIDEVNKAFAKVALFLEQDGVFIFDVNTVYKHEQVLANNTYVYDCDDVYCVWQNTTENGRTQIDLDFFACEDGAYYRSSESFCEVAYSDETLRQLLANHGLKVLACYDDYSRNPIGETTQRAVYVVGKE